LLGKPYFVKPATVQDQSAQIANATRQYRRLMVLRNDCAVGMSRFTNNNINNGKDNYTAINNYLPGLRLPKRRSDAS
jgi:hypothetical protein